MDIEKVWEHYMVKRRLFIGGLIFAVGKHYEITTNLERYVCNR